MVHRAIQYEVPSEAEPAKSIVIFVQTVDLVNLIAEKLADELEQKALEGREVEKKEKAEMRQKIDDRILKMTGEMRGDERDRIVKSEKFKAFLPDRDRTISRQPCYLIATSCAEVGVNLDADHGLCDLSTLDSMIQRIGRINRFGKTNSQIIVVVDETILNETGKALSKLEEQKKQLDSDKAKKAFRKAKLDFDKEVATQRFARDKVFYTWRALNLKEGESGRINASPLALRGLLSSNQKALPDNPIRPPFDEARIDDWAMTSLKQKEYPRPLVQYWLRGVIDDERATTTFVWRTDLDHFENDEKLTKDELAEMATTIPIQPQERANLATCRGEVLLKALAGKFPDKLIVITDPSGESKAYSLQQLKDEKKLFELLAFSTVILSCEVGGLDDDGNPIDKLPKEPEAVSDVVGNEWSRYLITRHSSDSFSIKPFNQPDTETSEPKKSWQAAVRSIKNKGFCKNTEAIQKAFAADSSDKSKDENKSEFEKAKSYIAYFLDRSQKDDFTNEDADDSASLNLPPLSIKEHDEDVEKYARFLAEKIGLPSDVIDLLAAAGVRHDLGKAREWWQKAIGNFSSELYAKSNNNSFDHGFNQGYRHEFGSLIDSLEDKSLTAHPDRDLILHLIAAHHGYARPYFPERAFDRNQPKPLNQHIAHETVLRFNRLQHQYGWWQLAYLEAVLKAADALASRDFSKGN
ncbi:MAG TPA: type I-U CRISPR-associated helicase/endonuclease Cas3, partial [Blastocatellia bacterium]|nr:type I-U CRISPR-associated helicase/endonuclease Cas3 [Blastocatellia bacterium]